jgi:hypothetical protein
MKILIETFELPVAIKTIDLEATHSPTDLLPRHHLLCHHPREGHAIVLTVGELEMLPKALRAPLVKVTRSKVCRKVHLWG